MATESVPPPGVGGGGNLRYIIIGVVLLLGAVGIWFGMQSCEPEPQQPVAQVEPDAGAPVD